MLEQDFEPFAEKADELLKRGAIKAIDFSGTTYQIEFFDPDEKKTFYPFLQFDSSAALKDYFCDCHADKSICLHLATARAKIFEGHHLPWHERFSLSFFNKIGHIYFEESVRKPPQCNKVGKGSYHILLEERALFIKTKNESQIEEILFKGRRETPENSIKFSNLTLERLQHWREGRADQELRYELSFWSDLMKLFFWVQDQETGVQLIFKEEPGSFPKECTLHYSSLEITFFFKEEDLSELIDSLKSQPSSLKLFREGKKRVTAIHFDLMAERLILTHKKKETLPMTGILFDRWRYYPTLGFIEVKQQDLLEENEIPKEKISSFLTKFIDIADEYLDVPIHAQREKIKYHLFFDEKARLHVEGYLFEIGDLQKKDVVDFEEWIYLGKRGFIKVEQGYFKKLSFVIPREKVAAFVSEQKLWLSDQKGFVTHLATLESSLTYFVDEEYQLHFLSESLREMEAGSFDFGEWVYYQGRGFFAKRRARIGIHVRAGVVVARQGVSRFIHEYREELEYVRHFFATQTLLLKSTLHIEQRSKHSLYVKPIYTFVSPYQNHRFYFFGEFLFIEGAGFSLIPNEFSLPEQFREEQLIEKEELPLFLNEQLPKLLSFVETLPVALTKPRQCDIEVSYLVRTGEGGLKAKLGYKTEFGRIDAEELYHAFKEGRRFLFSSVGLFDLKSASFWWLGERGTRMEGEYFLLSTLDFMKLDARESLLLHTGKEVGNEITEKMILSLRTFSVEQGCDVKGLKSQLRLYQQTGLKWLWFLYINGLSGLLCDDMGLGKTHQAMALMAAVINRDEAQKPLFLVVCPTSVIYHWQDKLAAFLPHVRVQMFHGVKRQLLKPDRGGVIITTYGIVRKEKALLSALGIDLAIYDEVQVAKNPGSGIHKALKELKARMHLGLTGTPIENSLTELRALFEIVLPGYLPKETLFREQYILPIEKENDEEKKRELVQLVKPFTLRRRKQEVLQELPSKTEDKSYCDLSEEQKTLYQEVIDARKQALLRALHDPSEKVPYMHIFSLLSSLKQICNHPALYKKETALYKKYKSGKWELFQELLNEALESEQKVVIFSQYLQMLDIMEHYLKDKKVIYAQIRGETQDRREQLERFQNDSSCRVFLGSLQAAGLGIDLTAASVVIMYDRWWNLARESQAIDRVHRMGQKWGVQVYKLITKGTIEEKIDLMITKKGRLMEEIVTIDDQATLKSFSRQELIELLGL